MFFPSTACLIQEKVGAKKAWGFDLSAACSGFLFALVTGAQFIENGAHKRVVVVGADKMSSITDYTDRNNCILFGDAAAAVLLEPCEDGAAGILDQILRCDGSGERCLHMRGGGSLNPPTHETVDKKTALPLSRTARRSSKSPSSGWPMSPPKSWSATT